MKTWIIILLSLVHFAESRAQNYTIRPALSSYLAIKDALVNSNAKQAAMHALAFTDSLDQISANILGTTPANQLRQSAKLIAGSTDLEKQRAAFAELSQSFWSVLKNSGYEGGTIYYDYCPMKKTYWISREAAIRNPYYGAKMLTCGNIVEKL